MKRNLTSTTLQVTAFSTVEKAVSFLYHIILSRLLGAEGVGIYHICLSVFAVFLTAASGGIPVTVTRLLSKERALSTTTSAPSTRSNAIITAGIISTLFFTIPASLILLLLRGAPFLFGDERCSTVFLILLPGLILTSIYAVMRGVFWGNKQFFTYSLIELLEDIIMVVVGTILLLVVHTHSAVTGAKLAALAVTISYVFSFTASLVVFYRNGGRLSNPKTQLYTLLSSSLPITATRTLSALLNSFVALLLPFLFRTFCGYTPAQATAFYGILMGMAIPILCMPSSFIGSIAVVLAPELSENFYKKHTRLLTNDIQNSVSVGMLIAVILIPLLCALGTPLGNFLYSNALSGQIISRGSFMLLPMCLSMITTTVLNSMNCEKKTMLYYIPATAAMLLCTVCLTKFLGIYAYLLGLGLNFTISAVCNLMLLRKKCPTLHLAPLLFKGVILIGIASLFGYFCAYLLSLFLPIFAQILVGAILILLFTLALLAVWLPDLFAQFTHFIPHLSPKSRLKFFRNHTRHSA